jgi:hypothetical protein
MVVIMAIYRSHLNPMVLEPVWSCILIISTQPNLSVQLDYYGRPGVKLLQTPQC